MHSTLKPQHPFNFSHFIEGTLHLKDFIYMLNLIDVFLKLVLPDAIFAATCLAMALRDKMQVDSWLTTLFGSFSHSKIKHKLKKSRQLKSCLKAVLKVYKIWSTSFKRKMKNNIFIDCTFYMGFTDLIWVTSSAENIDLARNR